MSGSEEAAGKRPEAAEAKLSDLASLLAAVPADVRLRVVGYTDPSGTPAKNRRVSLERAQSIVSRLQALEIPAERLDAVGRSAEQLLNDSRGINSENRRVEFEPLFSGDS